MGAGEYAEEKQEEQTLAPHVQINSQHTSDSDCLEPGSLFNSKYRVVKLLGQGGMSSVYQVEDIMLKRMVALKIMHPKYLSSDNAILRFQQEARAASMLQHSGIVTIHEFGVTVHGQPFLVMDYVVGCSLAEEIAGGPLPLARMIGIVSDVCDALAEAHRQGIVHRDIKPSNIMLIHRQDGCDSIKIVDFGIAKLAFEDVDQVALTQTGEVFGSPLYMSPEQCQGLKVDARADIYALGCLLYEGLCGHPPFTGNNALATMQQHINADPVSLSEIREADSKQIAQMQKILLGLLAKHPDQRYQNVQALKQDLAEVLAGRSVKMKVRRALSLKQRLTLGVVAATAILVPIGQTWLQVPRQIATVQPTVTLSKEQQRQLWEKEDLAGQKDFDQGNLQSARKHFLKALDAAKLCGDQKKEQIHAIAIGELCDLATVMRDDKLTSEYLIEEKNSQQLLLREKLSRMRPLLRELKEGIDRKKTMTDADLAQLNGVITRANAFAMECAAGGYFDLEREFLKYILNACERTHNELQIARIDINLGSLLARRGLQRPAEVLLKNGLALRKKLLPQFDPDLGRAFSFLGRAQLRWHTRDSAKNLLRANRIYSSAYGPASSQAGSVMSALAQFYKQENDKGQMRLYAENAVQILSNVQSSNPSYIGLLGDLGDSYLCLDRVTEASDTFQRVVDQTETLLDARFFNLSNALSDLKAVKEAQGKTAQAQALAARSDAISWRSSVVRDYLLPQVLAAFK